MPFLRGKPARNRLPIFGEHIAIKEAAKATGQSVEQIREKVLSFRSEGQEYISRSTFDDLELKATTSFAAATVLLSRRDLLMMGIGVGSTIIVGGAGIVIPQVLDRDRADREAVERFKDIFGEFSRSHHFDMVAGRPTYRGTFHPYNRRASAYLAAAMGIAPYVKLSPTRGLAIQRQGDIVVFGGPTSTPETMLLWEFEGEGDRKLQRRPNPLIPLRWWGGSHEDLEPSYQISYGMGEPNWDARTANWALIDHLTNTEFRASPGRMVEPHVFEPSNNFLIVTRLPNLLDPDLLTDLRNIKDDEPAPTTRSQLLVVEGMHGPGTAAIELLLRGSANDVLQQIRERRGLSTSFQVLLEVRDFRPVGNGLHRFLRIADWDFHDVPLTVGMLRRAHEHVAEHAGLPADD